MRFKTLVLIPLVAVSAYFVSLPASQNHASANAPQEIDVKNLTSTVKIEGYLAERDRLTASRSSARVSFSTKIVKTAKSYIGTPYCHGGEGLRCFDCSGFTQYVFGRNGSSIPRSVDQQLNSMKRIKRKDAIPGDLVFFLTKKGYAYHVGIYYGGNKIIHSPKPGRRVKVEEIWSTRIVFAR